MKRTFENKEKERNRKRERERENERERERKRSFSFVREKGAISFCQNVERFVKSHQIFC
jgi:hypothetical protein